MGNYVTCTQATADKSAQASKDAAQDAAIANAAGAGAAAVTPTAVLAQVQNMSPAQIAAMCAKLNCAPTAAALTQSLLLLAGSGVVGNVLAISAAGVASWVPDKQTELLASGPGYRAIRHSDGTIVQTVQAFIAQNMVSIPVDIVFPIQFPNACVSFVASVGVAINNYDVSPAYRLAKSTISYGMATTAGVTGQLFCDSEQSANRLIQYTATGY